MSVHLYWAKRRNLSSELSLPPSALHETNIIGTQNLFPNLNGKIIPEFSKSGDALPLYVKILIEAPQVHKGEILVPLKLREGPVSASPSSDFIQGWLTAPRFPLASMMEVHVPLQMTMARWSYRSRIF